MQSLRQPLTKGLRGLTKSIPKAAYATSVPYPSGYPSTSENLRIGNDTKVVFQGFVSTTHIG